MHVGYSHKTELHRKACITIGQVVEKIAWQEDLPGLERSEEMRKNAKEFLEIKAAQWSTLVGKPTRYDV